MLVLLIFALLCVWEGSQWLLPTVALDPVPFAWLSAVAFALVALCASAWQRRRSGGGARGRLGVCGALALGVPAMLLTLGQRYFAAGVAVAALAGVPVVIVVAAQVSSEAGEGERDGLLPAVAGLAGALLLIPVGLPASVTGWVGFTLDVGAVLLAGIFGVAGHRAALEVTAEAALVSVATGNAIALGLFAAVLSVARPAGMESNGVLTAGAVAGALGAAVFTALVAAMLLRAMRPLGFASRYLAAPLLASIEAYVMLRPTLSLREAAGALLMGGAGAVLLRAVPAAAGSVVPLRTSD